jgi:hypothetical protein
MDVLPPIRAPRDEHARPDYLEYLKSAGWRTTRNRALQLASYRCERCDSKRDLQVHHRTYERLGHEWDQDLEVLCDACHGDHHTIEQAKRGDPVRLLAVLVGQALHARDVRTYADLAEAVKCRAARLDVPYDSATLGRAIDLVTRHRSLFAAAPTVAQTSVAASTPINKTEALRIYASIAHELPQLRFRIRTMPSAPWSDPDVDERERQAARERAWEMGVEL